MNKGESSSLSQRPTFFTLIFFLFLSYNTFDINTLSRSHFQASQDPTIGVENIGGPFIVLAGVVEVAAVVALDT